MVGSKTHLSTSEVYRLIMRKKIADIFLVRYIYQGEIAENEGPVEIHFTNGTVLLFECGGDGEEMIMKKGEWSDPFLGEQSKENIEFIRKNGKWEKLTQGQAGFKLSVIGAKVNDISFKYTHERKVIGVTLEIGDNTLRLESDSDELGFILMVLMQINLCNNFYAKGVIPASFIRLVLVRGWVRTMAALARSPRRAGFCWCAATAVTVG